MTAAEEGLVKGSLTRPIPARKLLPLRQCRRKIYRGSERESRSTNIDGFHCWPHKRCFDREREPIEPSAMLGDSAAAVPAMTAASGRLFAGPAGFKKKRYRGRAPMYHAELKISDDPRQALLLDGELRNLRRAPVEMRSEDVPESDRADA